MSKNAGKVRKAQRKSAPASADGGRCACGWELPFLSLGSSDPSKQPDPRNLVVRMDCPICGAIHEETFAPAQPAGGELLRIRCNVALGVNCTRRPSPLRVAA